MLKKHNPKKKKMNRKRSKCNKQTSKKRLHSATYLILELVFLLCLLASDLILTVCYVEMFPHIGENCAVTEHTTYQNSPYNGNIFIVPQKT